MATMTQSMRDMYAPLAPAPAATPATKAPKVLVLSTPLLVGKEEAAALLCVSVKAVERLLAAGTLRRVELPGGLDRCLFRYADLEALANGLPYEGQVTL